jgi:hypothetical protein
MSRPAELAIQVSFSIFLNKEEHDESRQSRELQYFKKMGPAVWSILYCPVTVLYMWYCFYLVLRTRKSIQSCHTRLTKRISQEGTTDGPRRQPARALRAPAQLLPFLFSRLA